MPRPYGEIDHDDIVHVIGHGLPTGCHRRRPSLTSTRKVFRGRVRLYVQSSQAQLVPWKRKAPSVHLPGCQMRPLDIGRMLTKQCPHLFRVAVNYFDPLKRFPDRRLTTSSYPQTSVYDGPSPKGTSAIFLWMPPFLPYDQHMSTGHPVGSSRASICSTCLAASLSQSKTVSSLIPLTR